MKSDLLHAAPVAIAAALCCSIALADEGKEEHYDIWVRVVDDAIVTGSITEGDPGDPIDEVQRIFGAELGEDPVFPHSAVEPGFQILADKATVGATFAFDFTGPVLRWTPSGFDYTGESMMLGFGPAQAVSADGPASGFEFGTEADGSLHDHFDHTLFGPDGGAPDQGIYVLQIAFRGVSPVLLSSEPCFVVFNLGLSEEEHEQAEEDARLLLACEIDLSGDGFVGPDDLSELLDAWGSDDGAADLDESGQVDGRDLLLILNSWGYECS